MYCEGVTPPFAIFPAEPPTLQQGKPQFGGEGLKLPQPPGGNGIGRGQHGGGIALRDEVREEGQRIAAGVVLCQQPEGFFGILPRPRQDEMPQQHAALQQAVFIIAVGAVAGGKQRQIFHGTGGVGRGGGKTLPQGGIGVFEVHDIALEIGQQAAGQGRRGIAVKIIEQGEGKALFPRDGDGLDDLSGGGLDIGKADVADAPLPERKQ